MEKRAIVLGGAGLIGSHLCVRLLREGYDVFCIDKRSQSESPLLKNLENRFKFHYIKHDITIPYEIGCDELYNLTSLPLYGDNYSSIDDIKLASFGSINSLGNIAKSCGKVLYASSDDIYYKGNMDDMHFSPNRSKAEACKIGESIHRAYHHRYKIDTRIARLFSVYGSYSNATDLRVINKMIIDALNNRDIAIYGSGEQTRTFCWVEDVVNGLLRLSRKHSSERLIVADIGHPQKVSIRTLAEMIVDLCGSLSNIIHIEARPNEPLNKIPNLKIMEREVGWQAETSLREGLLRAISYIEKDLSRRAVSELSWIEVNG